MNLPVVTMFNDNPIFPDELPDQFIVNDHIGQYDSEFKNQKLDILNNYAQQHNKIFKIVHHQILEKHLRDRWPNLEISHSPVLQKNTNFDHFLKYKLHPDLEYKHFLCSFNGSDHASRKLLVAALERFGWFNQVTTSKIITFSQDTLDGHLEDYVGDQLDFYRKFFIGAGSEDFFQTEYNFDYTRFDHATNIYNLEKKITNSFIHIVSETTGASCYPFVTEKFLYSIVTRGLYLTYAQPGWHDHVEKYYGFKKYTRLFDYKFDSVKNPVIRLIELLSMIAKFSNLSSRDWHELYELEKETIEFNYDHYFSGRYFEHLSQQSTIEYKTN